MSKTSAPPAGLTETGLIIVLLAFLAPSASAQPLTPGAQYEPVASNTTLIDTTSDDKNVINGDTPDIGIANIADIANADLPDIDNDLDAVGRLHESNGNYGLAIDNYSKFVIATEEQQGIYSSALIEPMIGLARSYHALGDYVNANEYGARAQHLTHRNDGVYSLRQIEIIDLMTDAYLAQRDAEQADKTQKFSLFIAQHHYGDDSLNAIPAISKLGKWYVDSGQFTRADKLLNTQSEIVTNTSGALDPLHLPIIIERAKLKRLRRICCSHIVMQTALPILEKHPNLRKSVV